MKTTLVIEFEDENDAGKFKSYANRAKAQDGTVGGLYAGIACAAIKRATIREDHTPDLLAALEMAELELHPADERGACLCSQCAFRRAARVAIAKEKGQQ